MAGKPWSDERRRKHHEARQATASRKNAEIYAKAEPQIEMMRKERMDKMMAEQPLKEQKTDGQLLHEARFGYNMPKIDVTDPAQVEKRINEYFDFCEARNKVPTTVGIASWLGVGKERLYPWINGKMRAESVGKILQRAFWAIEELTVERLLLENRNPASIIFYLKNAFNYRDQTDVVIAQNDNNEQEMTKKDFEEYLLAYGKKIETKFVEK